MTDNLGDLTSIADLDRAIEESHVRPVLLFKHSNSCPVSTRAFYELQSYIRDRGSRARNELVVVQTARPVSDAIAARLGLEHASPQAIVVRRGRPVWNASHRSITASALAEAVDSALDNE